MPRVFLLLTTRMPTVTAIQFTQDQMRTLAGVSVETVRHWRKAVPYLASKKGRAARFSFADLLALAVTNELVSSLGVHIGLVSSGVDALFNLLADTSTTAIDGAIVFVTSTAASLHEPGSWSDEGALKQPTLAIPLNPLIARLQHHMLPVAPSLAQTLLRSRA